MFCKHCGNQLDTDAKFCAKCGNPVEGAAQSVAAQPVGEQPVTMPTPEGGKMASFAIIFKEAFNNYISKFWKLLLLQLLMVIPIGVIVAIGIGLSVVLSDTLNYTPFLIVGILLALVAVAFIIYWAVWIQVATIQMLLDQPAQSIKETLRTAKPKLRNYFFTSLLSGLLIMLGFFALVIPGIILLVMYGLSTYIAVAEDKGIMASIKTSRELARGRWWALFGRLVLFCLVYIGFFILVGIVDAILGGIFGKGGEQVFGNIVSFVVGPFAGAFSLAMYAAVKKVAGPVSIEGKSSTGLIVAIVIAGLLIPIMLVSSIVLLALNSARVKSRDAKRLADAGQIATALDLYFNDNGTYPQTLSVLEGQYLAAVPVAPTPQDGTCTAEENQYAYKLISSAEYELTFCLGTETQGFSAGLNSYGPEPLIVPTGNAAEGSATQQPATQEQQQIQNSYLTQ